MTECPSCEEARANPDTGSYHSDCLECSARALAHSHEFWESRLHMKMMPRYVQALTRVAGTDPKERDAFHRRVKTWADLIDEGRR